MAAALIGGAFLSGFLQVLFDRLAPDATVWDLFKSGNSSNNKLLRKLKTILIAVSKVLDDADKKEITDPLVKLWLDDLKDAVYDADDLLAVIVAESHVMTPGQSGVETEFGEKLQEILDILVELMEVKQHLGLEAYDREAVPLERRTTSLLDRSEVYGREADKEAITNLLMSEETSGINGLGVIAIVGMGGLGKTTLAQLVYGQKEVLEQFQLKAWVCVSEETDLFFVTRNILKEFAPTASGLESMTPNLLQSELKNTVTGKRFLLVLDDVWDERLESWNILLRPLKHGLRGSRIIVTTRSDRVASVASNAYSLRVLSHDECWSAFATCAFNNEDPSDYPDLVAIGREIIAKCGGLPLAANALGDLMRKKRDLTEWERIMTSEIWNLEDNRILPALRLSYHYLPSTLKRCFAYCALFPKNYEFKMDELVRLWMAEGILDSHEGRRPMEEIGDEYFGALLSRSFFQRSSVTSSCYVMHDLIHDLAKSVAGHFYYRLENDNPPLLSRKPRHLSYMSAIYNTAQIFDGIDSNQSLRSFLPIRLSRGDMYQYMDKDVIKHLLETSKCLRVLSLSNYVNIKEIPESIVNLKLLRYLDLSRTSIRRLPDVVCSLWNIETLLLEYCKYLKEVPDLIADLKCIHFLNLAGTSIKQLPTNLCNLVKLCALDIRRTKLQKMPPKMGHLTRLQKLTDFFVGEGNSCSTIKELKELSKLKGKLRIWNLQNVSNPEVALESNLKGKKHLRDLELNWEGDADDSEQELKILEGLEPPRTLEHLTVIGYRSTKFPEWVGHRSFPHLVSLRIEGCKNCCVMPPLGRIESLKELYISGCEHIVVIGPSFYGRRVPTTEKRFKSLEVLHFEEMPEWITWEQHDGDFPSLRELCLSKCSKLVNALPGELPSLKRLRIKGCDRLMTPFPRAPAIVVMELEDKNRRVNLHPRFGLELSKDHFPHSGFRYSASLSSLDQMLGDIQRMGISISDLKQVNIGYSDLTSGFLSTESCSLLEGVINHFKSLDSLAMSNCPKLVSFPKRELASPTLTKLYLQGLENLKSLPDQMLLILPCLLDLRLWGCPELESFPQGGLPSKLESLQISYCKKLMAGRKQWNLQALLSLSSFTVGGYYDEMESFPEETLLPSSLTTLVIEGVHRLKCLDNKGLQHLTNLQTLRIELCFALEKLPEEGLPQSLTTLEIVSLPNLKSLSPIQLHTSLKRLSIEKCDEISLVSEVTLPSAITSLVVFGLNIRSLDGWDFQRLTCLRELEISNCEYLESITEEALPSSLNLVELHHCPKLQFFPKEGFPFSLDCLYILDCPLLARKCQWEGEEWHRISYIPFISIDFRCLNFASGELYK